MRTKTTQVVAEEEPKRAKATKTVQFKENDSTNTRKPRKIVIKGELEEGEVVEGGQQNSEHAKASQESSIDESTPTATQEEKAPVFSPTVERDGVFSPTVKGKQEYDDEVNSQAWPESEESFHLNGDTLVRVVSGPGVDRSYSDDELNTMQSLPYCV